MASSDSGTSTLRFDSIPFQPDGGAPFLGTIGLFLGAALSGALAGWGVERVVGAWGCCCITGPIQVAVLSFILGGVGSWAVHFGKIRQPAIAGFAALVGVAASVIGKLYAEYERALIMPQIFLGGPQLVQRVNANQLGFLDYLQAVPSFHLGMIGLGLLIGAGGCIALMVRAASRPFCVTCQQWKSRFPVATLAITRIRATEVLETGALVELAIVDETLRPTDPGIIAYVCQPCGMESPIEIELIEIAKTKKNKEITHTRGIWTYPGWGWVVLQKLFPGRLPPPDPHAERFNSLD